MRNLNEYNQEEFESKFVNSQIAEKIKQEFDLLIWDKHVVDHTWSELTTHRQRLGSKIFAMSSFYYIEKLLNKSPTNIYDLGCGWNIFRNYIPEAIGISPEDPDNKRAYFGQEYDVFDNDFVKFHKDYYESIMAICSLHYRPISDIKKIVEQFISLVKPGGRGYIALDTITMVKFEIPEVLASMFESACPSNEQILNYVREQLGNLDCNLLVFDIDDTADEIDGNVRIVFERKV